MSGPVSTVDASPALPDCSHPSAPCVEATDIPAKAPYWQQEQR